MVICFFFRVLNVFAHVIDELVPGPPQIKASLPSLPQAPSLSPIKRKAKGEKETVSNAGTSSQDSKAAQKQSQKGQGPFVFVLNELICYVCTVS